MFEKTRVREGDIIQDESTEVRGPWWRISFSTSAMGGFKKASLPTLCFREIIAAAVWRMHDRSSRVEAGS